MTRKVKYPKAVAGISDKYSINRFIFILLKSACKCKLSLFKNILEWYNVSMNFQEILNVLLVIGLLIISFCFVAMTYFVVKALQSVIKLTDSLDETTQNIKGKLQMRFLAVLPALFIALMGKLIKKRG